MSLFANTVQNSTWNITLKCYGLLSCTCIKVCTAIFDIYVLTYIQRKVMQQVCDTFLHSILSCDVVYSR